MSGTGTHHSGDNAADTGLTNRPSCPKKKLQTDFVPRSRGNQRKRSPHPAPSGCPLSPSQLGIRRPNSRVSKLRYVRGKLIRRHTYVRKAPLRRGCDAQFVSCFPLLRSSSSLSQTRVFVAGSGFMCKTVSKKIRVDVSFSWHYIFRGGGWVIACTRVHTLYYTRITEQSPPLRGSRKSLFIHTSALYLLKIRKLAVSLSLSESCQVSEGTSTILG